MNEKIIKYYKWLKEQEERYNKDIDEHFFDDMVSIGKLQVIIECLQEYEKLFDIWVDNN